MTNSDFCSTRQIFINKSPVDNKDTIIWNNNKFKYFKSKNNGLILRSLLSQFLLDSMFFGYTIYLINMDFMVIYTVEQIVYNYNRKDNLYHYKIQNDNRRIFD